MQLRNDRGGDDELNLVSVLGQVNAIDDRTQLLLKIPLATERKEKRARQTIEFKRRDR